MTKWTMSHPQSQIIGDPSDRVKTRCASTIFCFFTNFVSITEPKKIFEALEEPNWTTSEHIILGLKLKNEDSVESSRTNELHHLFEDMFNDDGPSEGDHRASEADVSKDQTRTSLTGPSNTSPSPTTCVGTNIEGELTKTNNNQGSMPNQDEDHLPTTSEGSTPEQSQNSNQGTTELSTSTQ
ncbi:hypothetical protein L6452_35970 [Arctium lappa]|uniref:Uncharacterized protein n=1 Tax=Arctium lappa TaxID=4217 RepID=A0ACB8Y7A2_ARCLA|nr:hypothetical protein L6452_35970 [Arctium lappa]